MSRRAVTPFREKKKGHRRLIALRCLFEKRCLLRGLFPRSAPQTQTRFPTETTRRLLPPGTGPIGPSAPKTLTPALHFRFGLWLVDVLQPVVAAAVAVLVVAAEVGGE